MAKTLIVGPAICEFGWNLMAYNPFARKLARRYDKVVVCCPKGEEYIWEFADEFYHIKKPDRADRWLIKNGRPIKVPKELVRRYPGADKITPNKLTCSNPNREYRKFGNKPYFTPSEGVVTIHARSTQKYNQGNRNWPVINFSTVLATLGMLGRSIGTQAYLVPGTADHRNLPLENLCESIRSSSVVIGPSSGPMHLASLCGIPHVVWTYNKKEKAIKGTNRQRYEKLWNPFNTPVKVIDEYGWDPPPHVIANAVKKILKTA